MDSIALIMVFDEPFWIGVSERRTGSSLQAAKTVFGAEPADAEVRDVLLNRWTAFVQQRSGSSGKRPQQPIRSGGSGKAARLTASRGISTKAQQALAAQREVRAEQRKTAHRGRRDEKAGRKFRMRQQKRREKHRGALRAFERHASFLAERREEVSQRLSTGGRPV